MKISILVLVLFLAAGFTSWGGDVLLSLSLDWMLSLRLGLEVPVNPCFALRTDWGASLFGTVVGDLFAVLHAMPPDSPLRIALLVGYRFTERLGMDLRAGLGYPLFFEADAPMIRDLPHMPLGLWPDLTASVFLRL